jgi:hypothetical protein
MIRPRGLKQVIATIIFGGVVVSTLSAMIGGLVALGLHYPGVFIALGGVAVFYWATFIFLTEVL